ncbi:hypothetical protein O181_069956 [Austropuccinia psidii MF-1]|uniref:Uncharacterized protein n=1 Tax=Austropuccinia psidii MF-1 TaxID=1389203 RepID=A0A9Q3F4G6_9BASI|nr:hypothetical protein [Austropuccinia psidii MF-1]
MTELTESSSSALPPSVLCGSVDLSQLASPSMASSGHFNPSQTYDSYKAVEVLDPACTECFAKVTGSRQRDVVRWTNVGGPIPVGGRPIYSSSDVPIFRINTEGVVKGIRRIADSPPDPDPEGVMNWMIPKSFHPQYSQKFPTHSCYCSYFPSSNFTKFFPCLTQAVRPSPIQKPRNSPIITSQQLQPMDSSSRRRDVFSPLPFPATQVFQRRDCWPIQVTREDPNVVSKNQEAVARLFRGGYYVC